MWRCQSVYRRKKFVTVFHSLKPQFIKFSRRPALTAGLEAENVKKNWEDAVKDINSGVTQKTQPLFINKNKELIVKVADHLWLQEMSFYRDYILKKLTQRNKTIIKSIRFIV